MSTISYLKDTINTKTLHLVLLSIASFGIYPLMWIYRNHSIISKTTKYDVFSDTYAILMAVCVGLTSLSGVDENLDLLLTIPSLALFVFYLIFSFKCKKALQSYALNEYKIDLKMNVFYTILFNQFYINYCINDLPEAQKKYQILHSQTEV